MFGLGLIESLGALLIYMYLGCKVPYKEIKDDDKYSPLGVGSIFIILSIILLKLFG